MRAFLKRVSLSEWLMFAVLLVLISLILKHWMTGDFYWTRVEHPLP